jgi:elongator complex protein 6
MSSRHRAPLLALENYLQIPRQNASLFLLTSTLGYTVNWLVSQYVSVALERTQSAIQQDELSTSGQDPCVVLLVSWLRDFAFWKQEVRRTSVRWLQ